MSECSHDCASCKEKCEQKSLLLTPNKESSIKKIIAVVSGKGGVGKSMVTSLLAVSLARRGHKVGILDADVTGPSIPRAFGVTEKCYGTDAGILPGESAGGIKMVSLNLLLDKDTDPVVWRGPVIASTVKQFYTDVCWGQLDYLLVDCPPGTGDVPLTVFQSLPLNGILVVTSPQALVGMIVEKAVNMAGMMKVPVLGVVENMSYLTCPECKTPIYPFGRGRVMEDAARLNLRVLAQLPIDPELAALCDGGQIEKYAGGDLLAAVDVAEMA